MRPPHLRTPLHRAMFAMAAWNGFASLAVVAGAASSAFAQGTGSGTQVVTVTATKRTQTIQEVPLAVTALSGAELERRGTLRWEDALVGEPSLSISSTGSTLGSNIAIRGVSDGAAGGLTQSTVALYIDDMPLSFQQVSGNPSLMLYDIEQITVIRGPRSTLYGASSLGGTVKIETPKPSLRDRTGFVRAGLGRPASSGGWNTELAGGISVPLSANVAALGVTAYSARSAGINDHPTLGKDVNGGKTEGARLSLYIEPTKGLSVSGKVYLQDMDNKASSTVDATRGGDRISLPTAVLEPSTDRFRAASLNIKYRTEAFEIVSATSHVRKKLAYTNDLTNSFGPILAGFGVPAGTPIVSQGAFESTLTSQEMRVMSAEVKSGWVWSAGLFLSDEETANNGSTPSPIGEIFGSLSNFRIKQRALFGELGYKLGNGLEVNAGLRRTDYENRSAINLLGLFAVPGTNNAVINESPSTPHISLAYRAGRQMVYAQASKGFRLGRGNFPVIPVPGFDVPQFAGSDSLWTYELGAKTSLAGNSLQINAALYQTRWKNPQLTLSLPTGFAYVNSIGALNPGAGIEVNGFEMDLVARPTKALRLAAGIGYTDSTFTKDVSGLDPTGAVVKAGSRTAGIPRLTANASLRYDFEVAGRPASVDAMLRHVGGYDNDYNSLTRQQIGKRTTVDLRASTSIGNAEVALFVNNATDEKAFVSLFAAPYNIATPTAPRTFGFVVDYRF